MKKLKNNKKRVGALVVIFAVVMVAAGTFAWTSYTDWVKNHLQSAGYEKGAVNLIEDFVPKDINANANIKKKVQVQNNSESGVIARVSFEEMLSKLSNSTPLENEAGYSVSESEFPVIVDPSAHAGWTEVTSADIEEPASGLPAGVKMYRNGTSTMLVNQASGLIYKGSGDTANTVSLPEAFLVIGSNEIPVVAGDWSNGATVEQKVTADVVQNVNTNKLRVTNLKYYTYDTSTYVTTGNDWVAPTINLNTTNYPTLASITTTEPAATDFNKSSLSDQITFGLGAGVTAGVPTTQPATATWFYADGYFYYTHVLETGTTSNSVLEYLNFGSGVDASWKLSSYDLWVGLDAIPANQAALEAQFNGSQIGSGGSGWSNASAAVKSYYKDTVAIPSE